MFGLLPLALPVPVPRILPLARGDGQTSPRQLIGLGQSEMASVTNWEMRRAISCAVWASSGNARWQAASAGQKIADFFCGSHAAPPHRTRPVMFQVSRKHTGQAAEHGQGEGLVHASARR